MATLKRGFPHEILNLIIHLMINIKMFSIILMVGTVDTPPSLLMSKAEKRKDFSHDHATQWAGCVMGDACYPVVVLCSTAVVTRCSGQGDWRAWTYQQKQVVPCVRFLHGVSLNACAQYDLIYMHRVDPVLSSKAGHPFSCMPFTVCLYMKSLTVGWLFSSDGMVFLLLLKLSLPHGSDLCKVQDI